MGLMTTLLKLTGGKLDTRGNAPGKSAIATGEGMDGQTITTEVYQSPGVFGLPPEGLRAVWIPIGNSGRYGLALATHNYQIEIDVGGAGGMAIYSTNSDGDEVKAKVVLEPGGKIIVEGDTVELNGDDKKLVTYAELNTALNNFKSSIESAISGAITGHTHVITTAPGTSAPGVGSAPPVSLDISEAETTTIKTGG